MDIYTFDIAEYRHQTGHLTLIEDVAYRRMIDWCYFNERSLPIDVKEISRVINMRDHECDISQVLSDFFKKHECGWYIPKIAKKITNNKARSKSAVKKNNIAKLDYSSWPSMPSDQLWKDWQEMRIRKKHPISQTVINRAGTELQKAIKAGFTVDDCFGLWIERNWQGFNAEWIMNIKGNINGQYKRFTSNLERGKSARKDWLAEEKIQSATEIECSYERE